METTSDTATTTVEVKKGNSKKAPATEATPLDELLLHPAAKRYPLLPEDEQAALDADIEARGQIEPIDVLVDAEGTRWLLDGRHRLDACRCLHRKPLIKELTLDDVGHPSDWVYSRNVPRRHLTPPQRAMAIVFNAMDKAPDKKLSGLSHKQLAKKASGTNREYVRQALAIARRNLSIAEQVMHGADIAKAYAMVMPKPKPTPAPKRAPRPPIDTKRTADALHVTPDRIGPLYTTPIGKLGAAPITTSKPGTKSGTTPAATGTAVVVSDAEKYDALRDAAERMRETHQTSIAKIAAVLAISPSAEPQLKHAPEFAQLQEWIKAVKAVKWQ